MKAVRFPHHIEIQDVFAKHERKQPDQMKISMSLCKSNPDIKSIKQNQENDLRGCGI